jgi:hypothetical protein
MTARSDDRPDPTCHMSIACRPHQAANPLSGRAFEIFDRFGKHHLRGVGRTCRRAAGRSIDCVAAYDAVSSDRAHALRACDPADPELLAIIGCGGVAPGNRYGFGAKTLDKGHDGALRDGRWRSRTIGCGAAARVTGTVAPGAGRGLPRRLRGGLIGLFDLCFACAGFARHRLGAILESGNHESPRVGKAGWRQGGRQCGRSGWRQRVAARREDTFSGVMTLGSIDLQTSIARRGSRMRGREV